jgi:hypothetical protein
VVGGRVFVFKRLERKRANICPLDKEGGVKTRGLTAYDFYS